MYLKEILQAKYKFTSFYRTSYADLRSAISFCMHHLVYEVFVVKFINYTLNSLNTLNVDLTRRDVIE